MNSIKDAAAALLASKRAAVAGVSRTPKTHGSNNVYRRLRKRGYQVSAVNPKTGQVEGDRCYKDLAPIPGGVEAVVIGTRPQVAEDTMRECAELGIRPVWMHRGPGAGSVLAAAAGYGRAHGITVIDGGGPLMFGAAADFGHKVMRLVYAGQCPSRYDQRAPAHRLRARVQRAQPDHGDRPEARYQSRACGVAGGAAAPGSGPRAHRLRLGVTAGQACGRSLVPVSSRRDLRPWRGGCGRA